MKVKESSVLSREQVFSRIREVVERLEQGDYRVEGRPVRVGDAAELEVAYKEKRGRGKLEIEIVWPEGPEGP